MLQVVVVELSDPGHRAAQLWILFKWGRALCDTLLSVRGIALPRKASEFDIVSLILREIAGKIRKGDVLVISSKFVAISEGRVVNLKGVRVGQRAVELARRYQMDEKLCELVVRESDEIIGGIPGFILASKNGVLTPNAGIDKSNIGHGSVVLYPRRPEDAARMIRSAVKFETGASIGVVVCDSRLAPTRRGTVGVAVGASGLEGILDLRGKRDLFGNVLKVTSQAIADDLCSAAELLMGESDEASPLVLVRGLSPGLLVDDLEYPPRRFAISIDNCVYMRSLGYDQGLRRRRNRLLAGTPRVAPAMRR